MTPKQGRIAPAPPTATDEVPEARRDRAPPLLQRVQGGAGNRAAAGLMQRAPGGPGAPVKDAGPTLAAFDAANPGITAALSYEQLKVWHDVIEDWAANRKVDDALVRHEKHERSTFLDPSSTAPIMSSDYLDQHARIASRRTFVDEAASRFALTHSAILAPEISLLPAWNVGAEGRFRSWAVAQFASRPLVAELSSKRELVSALEESQNPGLQSGIPHVNLLWGGGRIRHTKGIVTWDDLMHITEFSERYRTEVSDGPEIQALRDGIAKLDSHIQTMKIQHQTLSDANAEHGVVRHISEALGSPSPIEIEILRMNVRQSAATLPPKKLQALENLLAEKEAETGSYPMLRDNEKGEGTWHFPDLQLAAAKRFFEGGQIELALGAMRECEESTTLATSRFAGYERRVMGGAGIAVKWLERAKTAGKMASAFTGTGGVVRAAFGAAGYSFAQEGSQQVVAHWIDSSNEIDLGGLAEQAAIEGLASLIGGVTQGAFVEALTVRFGTRLVASGMSEATAKAFISVSAATTASFYNVPAKAVLDRVIAGKALPTSLADVSQMVVDEAMTSAVMDAAGSFVHASGAQHEAGKAAPEVATPHTGPEIAAPREIVDALAGSEAAPRPGERAAPITGRGEAPTTIIAEARMIAGKLEPLRAKWAELTPAQRGEQLIDAVHEQLAATGVPKPKVNVLDTGVAGGFFHQDTWSIDISNTLVGKKNVTVEEFAWACEVARHEMEHAMQYFRVARREHAMTGETAQALADRLHIARDTVQDAVDAHSGKRKAEAMPAGGALDTATSAIYQNVYHAKEGARRAEVLNKLEPVVNAMKAADAKLGAGQDAVLEGKAFDEWIAAKTEHDATMDEYRNFPEEVPAFKAGAEVAAAVKEQALLADSVKKLQKGERDAYTDFTKVRDANKAALTDPEHRNSVAARRQMRAAMNKWVGSLERLLAAEKHLTKALESGTPK